MLITEYSSLAGAGNRPTSREFRVLVCNVSKSHTRPMCTPARGARSALTGTAVSGTVYEVGIPKGEVTLTGIYQRTAVLLYDSSARGILRRAAVVCGGRARGRAPLDQCYGLCARPRAAAHAPAL